MNSLFTIFASMDKVIVSFILIAITLGISIVFNLLISLRLRASKSFFITSTIMPLIVTAVIAMVSIFLDSTATSAVRIATIAVALGLIRFRSVNSRGEELLILFSGIAFGLICGLGYAAFAGIFASAIAMLYLGLSYLNIFQNKRFGKERLLKITIPESLEYKDVFNDTFSHYLRSHELVRVKTTAMGSLFSLSYKIELKNGNEEKELIDELRTKNGNLEISILPYVEEDKSL